MKDSKKLIAITMLLVFNVYFGVAIAQNEPDGPILEEITVYGDSYADSIRKALTVKRNADNVVEALSAEDIGKLPGVTIAESLATLPGLTSDRDVAGAGAISIRGMGAVLSNSTFNGREVTSASDSRSVDFSQFPSELITGAAVYKTPTARIIEGGIAGTVELKSVEPLDYEESLANLSIRTRYNDLAGDLPGGDEIGYRGSFSYIDQFNDGRLGVAFGYSRQDSPFVSVESSIFDAGSSTIGDLGISNLVGGSPDQSIAVPFGADNGISVGESDRDGFLAVLQWRPNDELELKLDGVYSIFNSSANQAGLQLDGVGGDFSSAVVANEALLSASASGSGNLRSINAAAEEESELFSAGLATTWERGKWKVTSDFGYSRATLDDSFERVSTRPFDFSANTPTQIAPSFSFGENSSSAAFLTSPLDFSNPDINRVTDYQIFDDDSSVDELVSIQLDAEHFFDESFVTSIVGGVRYVDRDKELIFRGASSTLAPEQITPFTAAEIRGVLDQDSIDSQFNTNAILLLNLDEVIARRFSDVRSVEDPIASAQIEEETISGFLQLNYAGDIFGAPVTGNFGVRLVNTDVRTAGIQQTSTFPPPDFPQISVQTPVNTSNDETYVLPSFNAAFEVADNTILRLAAAKTIARPPLNFLTPGFDQFGDSTFGLGNPFLEPYEATQFDLTLEKYFSDTAALTLSVFYKDLDSFIVQSNGPASVRDVNNPTGPLLEGVSFQARNESGGFIRGAEVFWQQAFTSLPSPFNRFGINANYSYTESNVTFGEEFVVGEFGLDGLSNNVGSVTLWYTDGPFDARIGYRFRSEFSRPQRDAFAFITNDDEEDLSFQVTYAFSDALKVTLQGYNLTDDIRDGFYGDPLRQGQFRRFGKNYELGFSYSF